MYKKETFAAQLKFLLRRKGITQRALAEQMHTTEATISRYLAGARTPDIETAVALAGVFDVSMDTLVGAHPHDCGSLPADENVLLRCYQKLEPEDRRVLWTLLDRYLTPSERQGVREAIESMEHN